MTGKVQVEVAGMRSTATGLEGVATQIYAIQNALEAASKSYHGSWGNDEFGNPFAEGDGGYEKRDPALLAVLQARADRLREYSKGLLDGATSLETAEANNTDSFRS